MFKYRASHGGGESERIRSAAVRKSCKSGGAQKPDRAGNLRAGGRTDSRFLFRLGNGHIPVGIGDGIIPEILNQKIYDEICIVTDEEAISTSKALASEEGIMCGISSGTNVAAARKLARVLGPGKTVVTVLPDTAERYFSTPLFED